MQFFFSTSMYGRGALDQFKEEQDGENLRIVASGWAVNTTTANDRIVAVEMFFDEKKIFVTPIQPVERPDVADFLKNKEYLYSGWTLKYIISPGTHLEHEIKALVIFSSGFKEELRRSDAFQTNVRHLKKEKETKKEIQFTYFLWDILLTSFPVLFWGTLGVFMFREGRRQFSRKGKTSFYQLLIVLLLSLVFFYISDTLLWVRGENIHDDALYVSIAEKIAQGKWSGSYNQISLTKGIGYPFWIAANNKIGFSLAFSQFLYYFCMCALVVIAVRPLLTKNWISPALFLFLLFNPVTLSMNEMAAVLRSGIIPACVLGIVSGAIGMYARREEKLIFIFPWSLLGGFSMSLFWLTREEGVWILPLIFFFYIPFLFSIFNSQYNLKFERMKRLSVALLPGAIFLFLVLSVCTVNYLYYGIFNTCELKETKFNDAYGALLRIEPTERKHFVPVSKEMREMAYSVSPAFREMQPWLEGRHGKRWSKFRARGSTEPIGNGELEGGWFIWALRDAAADAGHARTARDAQEFYSTIAKEINDACDQKIIPSIGRRSGFSPVLEKSRIGKIFTEFGNSILAVLRLEYVSYNYPISSGDNASLKMFDKMTKTRFTNASPPHEISFIEKSILLQKLKFSEFFYSIYRWIVPVLFFVAFFFFLISVIHSLIVRRVDFWLFFNTGILCSVGILCLIVTLIKVEVWGAYGISYLSPMTPLFLLFCFTAWFSYTPPKNRKECNASN